MSDGTHTTNSFTGSTLPALAYNGEMIHQRNERLSLTDMWRAAGAPEEKRPADWLALSSTTEFRSAVEATFNAGKSGIIGERGRGKGTWAHWQIALAYAKYLSPDFHMWCNTVVRERMEGRAFTVPAIDMNAVGGMVKGILAKQLQEIVPALVAAEIATHTLAIRRGKTAGQIWKEAGFPPIRIGGWFSRKLREMGCEIEGGGCGELGLATARLFDPDKAALWLRNGGRIMVEMKLSERMGQGKLKLVPAAA